MITTLSGQAVNDLTFSNITFNGVTGSTTAGGGQATAHVAFQKITQGGEQELVITGNGGSAATFGGTVSFVLGNAVPSRRPGFDDHGLRRRGRARATAGAWRPWPSEPNVPGPEAAAPPKEWRFAFAGAAFVRPSREWG